MHTTAIVECKVCGAERVLGVGVSVKSAEVAEFAGAHASHGSYGIHLRLGLADQPAATVDGQGEFGTLSLQEI